MRRASLRLLFVGTDDAAAGTAGAADLVTAMAAAGHEVVAAVRPDGVEHRALAADERVRTVPTGHDGGEVRLLHDVLRLARTTRPDWIVGALERAHLPLAAVARLVGARVALLSHRDQRMPTWAARQVAASVHRIVAPSEYHRRRLVERGMPADRVAVLHHPVDAARLRIEPRDRAEARLLLGFRPGDVVVGFVGPLDHASGVEPLTEALRRAMIHDRSIRALWVGDGECAPRLRECVARWGHADRHVWCPWGVDPLAHYAAMDVLALPSVGCEPVGRVLVEAQACGLPVLGSRCGDIPEALEPGVTGLLLEPRCVVEWADSILRLAGDEAERQRMGAVGRAFARRVFDARVIAAEFGRLLADDVAGAPSRA